MASYRFPCGRCGHELSLDAALVRSGGKVKCPSCESAMLIPADAVADVERRQAERAAKARRGEAAAIDREQKRQARQVARETSDRRKREKKRGREQERQEVAAGANVEAEMAALDKRRQAREAEVALTCEKCASTDLRKTELYRLSGCLVAIGYTLWIPAAALLIVQTLTLLLTMVIGAFSTAAGEPVGGVLGALAFVFGGPMIVAFYFACVPALIIGLLLTLKRKVWRCHKCGYTFERT